MKASLNKTQSLGKLADTIVGGMSSSHVDEEGTPIRFIKAKDLDTNGRINIDFVDVAFVNNESTLQKYLIHKDDVLISRAGLPNKVAFVSGEQIKKSDEKFVISNNIVAVSFNKNIIHPAIVAFYLRSPQGQYELQKRASGSAMQSINTNRLKEIPIPVPPLEEQKIIVDFLSVIDEFLTVINQEKSLIDRLSEAVIADIIGGEKRG